MAEAAAVLLVSDRQQAAMVVPMVETAGRMERLPPMTTMAELVLIQRQESLERYQAICLQEVAAVELVSAALAETVAPVAVEMVEIIKSLAPLDKPTLAAAAAAVDLQKLEETAVPAL